MQQPKEEPEFPPAPSAISSGDDDKVFVVYSISTAVSCLLFVGVLFGQTIVTKDVCAILGILCLVSMYIPLVLSTPAPADARAKSPTKPDLARKSDLQRICKAKRDQLIAEQFHRLLDLARTAAREGNPGMFLDKQKAASHHELAASIAREFEKYGMQVIEHAPNSEKGPLYEVYWGYGDREPAHTEKSETS